MSGIANQISNLEIELDDSEDTVVKWNRKNPFDGLVKTNTLLSKEGSSKEIRHVVFDIGDSGIAYEAGDADAILTAQENLPTAKIKSDKLDNFKVPTLQEESDEVKTKEEPPVVDKKAQDWASKNTWFGTDDEMTSLALGLHNKLAKQGVDLQSDEYYEAIDTRMRQLFPDKFEEEIAETEEAEKPKKQANVVAPATRSVAPKKVKLTQTQVAIAKRLGVPIELYAQKVAEEMRKD